MIDTSLVVERFLLYADMEQADSKINSLCQSCKTKIEHLVKDTVQDNDDRLICAAASDAFYRWVLLEKAAGDGDFSSVRAGDITVKSDYNSLINAAEKIRNEAFSSIKGLIVDNGFWFGEVSIDDVGPCI